MIKLQFSNPHYKVCNDGKLTICVYECNILNTSTSTILESFKVTGKALCAKEDTVNPAIGRMIADSRAKYSAYKKAKAHWSQDTLQYIKYQYQASLDIIDFVKQMNYLKKSENEHITSLRRL